MPSKMWDLISWIHFIKSVTMVITNQGNVTFSCSHVALVKVIIYT